jgi:uncharacterized protein YsxB (DUF464 family)
MTTVTVFVQNSGKPGEASVSYTGLDFIGHSDWGAWGEDIVCAGVSSAVQLALNVLSEVFEADPDLTVEQEQAHLFARFPKPISLSTPAGKFIRVLVQHFESLQSEYPQNLTVITKED